MTIADVLSGSARYHVETCRAEALLDELPNGCVSLIATDPPYYKVVKKASAPWDHEHDSEAAFLDWIGSVFDRFRRVLASNGTLYVFASPQMAWGVEGEARKRFQVLNNITWHKPRGRADACHKEDLRSFFPDSERVILAEQRGTDSMAMSQAGYVHACDDLRGNVFEPIRTYLDGERERAGFTRRECDRALGNQMSGHYFSPVQWTLPTAVNYEKLRALFNSRGVAALGRDYSALGRDYSALAREYADLREQYDKLREQYEALRRPFTVSASVPYTDVWTYPTVAHYDGKHVCEKNWTMGLDMVAASSRPNDLVLDCFSGSGTFPAAAIAQGRRVIACDADPHWADWTRRRIEKVIATGGGTIRRVPKKNDRQLSLLG